MADSPSQSPSPSPTTAAVSELDTSQYWCYHCNKRVSIETLANRPDVICLECKNGFVESIATSDQGDDSSFASQFLQIFRILAHRVRDLPQDPQSDDDFLRIELNGRANDEDEDDDDLNENENENDGERDGGEHEGEEVEDRSENEENREEEDEEDLRRRRRDILRLRIRDSATRATSGRNRILDWAGGLLMQLEDNSIEFRLEVPETNRYIGNPEDYVDAAGYEALLQNLAESDGGRRGAPPASKSAVSALPVIDITSEKEIIVCAICKDMVNVGEKETRLPCGHGYHGDCIVPWLGSRNSCPVCRFELATDDSEYEDERKKKGAATFIGASGSGADNLGSN